MSDVNTNQIRNLLSDKISKSSKASRPVENYYSKSIIFNGNVTFNNVANEQSLEDVVKQHIQKKNL